MAVATRPTNKAAASRSVVVGADGLVRPPVRPVGRPGLDGNTGPTRRSAPTLAPGEHPDAAGRFSLHRCAFCGGSGRDPFGLLSPLALCGVCRGTGQVRVEEPVVECAFCSGTGVYPLGSRLTCTPCRGKGVLTVAEPTIACPQCHGTGQDPESGSDLYCLNCRGAGVVANKTSTLSLRGAIATKQSRSRGGLGARPGLPRFARNDKGTACRAPTRNLKLATRNQRMR